MEYKDDEDTSVIIVWECSTAYSHGVSGVFRGCDQPLALALKEAQVHDREQNYRGLPPLSSYTLDDFESLVCQGELIWSRRRPYYDMFNFTDIYKFKLPFSPEKFSDSTPGRVPSLKYLCAYRSALGHTIDRRASSSLPDADAEDFLRSVRSQLRAPLFVAYWQDAVKKIVDSACVIGVFTRLEDAKIACENVNRLHARWRELEEQAEDAETISNELLSTVWPKNITEAMEESEDEIRPQWGEQEDFHWIPSKSSVYSMIFVVQAVPNPFVDDDTECQNRELGYHCGKHPR